MKYNPLTRRMFLQGMGGYALAIPLLPSLLTGSEAEAAATSNLRLAMVHSPMGRDPTTWYPSVSDAQMNFSNGVYSMPFSSMPGDISYSFGSNFNNVRGKIAILRGLDGLQNNGMHNTSLMTTGSPEDPRTSTGFGYSIDSVLEESKKFYPTQPMKGAIRVCPNPTNSMSDFANISWTSKSIVGQQYNTEWSATTVYNQLLNPNNVQMLAARNQKILGASNLVTENFKRVMSGRRISSVDKSKLDQYLGLINEIDKSLSSPMIACGMAKEPGASDNPSAFHKAMFQMEAAALSCGVTRITMHSIVHCDDTLRNESWHPHAHGGVTDIDASTGKSYQAGYNKFHMSLVAYYLNLLDSIPDGNGTLLDNTYFMYGNEDSTGSHTYYDLPVLLAGAKGKLKTGYFYDYRPRPLVSANPGDTVLYLGRPYNNALTMAFKAFGLTPDEYQKQGITGFGRYDKIRKDLTSHYAPFLGAQVNEPLPGIYIG